MTTNATRPENCSLVEEKTVGPIRGMIGATVWKGCVWTDACGTKNVRLVSLAPRIYGDLKDSTYESQYYRVNDIPALIVALQKALEYCYAHPLYGDGERDSDIPK